MMAFPTPGYQTVRDFVTQSYKLINPSNPTVPLHGNDLSLGITILNQLVQNFAGPGLMLTIAKTVSVDLTIGQNYVTCGDPTVIPTPNITLGRLATLDSAWLLLDGVTYPLIDESRNQFFASFKYDPLQGLPRFVIVLPDTDVVNIRIYPAPSQVFTFNMRGKFQLPLFTSNSDMSLVPQYFIKFLLFAVAKDLSFYNGRSEAWTDKLERELVKLEKEMQASSEVNVSIVGDRESLLNGSWRVMAGV